MMFGRRARVMAVQGPSLVSSAPVGVLPLLVTAALAACAVTLASPRPLTAAVLLFAAPLAEEAFFRAGLQEWLLRHRFSPWGANLLTAVSFTLAHCIARGTEPVTLAVLVPALALGWIYGRSRSLRLCIALHMLMNVIWISASGWALPLFRSL
jgi:membrane protease YdiL (CAAX protease family)